MKTKCLWVLALLFVAMVQPALCEQIKGIKNLWFFESRGDAVDSGVMYELSFDGQYTVKIKLDGEPYEKAKTYAVGNEAVKALTEVFNEYEVWKWDGFNEHDSRVTDGDSFSFSLTLQDGKTIEARGYEEYPQNYGKVTNELERIILEGKGEVIDEGEADPVVTNIEKIKSLFYALYEKTDYGFGDKSSYELISDGDEYAVSIQHEGEKHEEAKTYPVSNEQVREVIKLLNKYEVWKWDGFEAIDYHSIYYAYFAMTVQDDKVIVARGYGIYPKNFGKVVKESIRILTRDIEEEGEKSILEWKDVIAADGTNDDSDKDEGEKGILMPIIIGAGVLLIVLVVIGVVRKKKCFS
jgi:hypothetical protein